MEILQLYSRALILITFLIFINGYYGQHGQEELPPIFDTSPINMTAIAGENVTLPCSVENIQDHVVAWMNPKKLIISNKERRILDDIRMTIERPREPDWHLRIRDIRFSDDGMYMCMINTNPVLFKPIYLTVLDPEYSYIEGNKASISTRNTVLLEMALMTLIVVKLPQ